VRRAAAAALALLAGSGCASAALRCAPAERRAVVDTLYLGANRAGGAPVSAEEWQAFLAEVVTPAFPDGITAWDASGQWRGSSHAVEHESSHVLRLVHDDTAAGNAAVGRVASAYAARFHQEAVLRTRTEACVALTR
jgi:hypothetical protein